MESAPKYPNLNLDDSVVVALGSNVCDGYATCEALLEAALEAFPGAGLPVIARSGWWRSAAWPDTSAPEYRNGVALVETNAPPEAVLAKLHAIECRFRRVRVLRNEPRTLDLDLIAYGRRRIRQPGLTLPHPRAADRRFVMGPLAEIAPGWRHPGSGKAAAELVGAASVGRDAEPV